MRAVSLAQVRHAGALLARGRVPGHVVVRQDSNHLPVCARPPASDPCPARTQGTTGPLRRYNEGTKLYDLVRRNTYNGAVEGLAFNHVCMPPYVHHLGLSPMT
jgi:hypothetical protein